MTDLADSLTIKAREYELMLIGAAVVQPEIVYAECSWIKPEDFSWPPYASFWSDFLASGDGFGAATKNEIEVDVMKAVADIPSPIRHDEYSRKVSEYAFLRASLSCTKKIVTAIINRDSDMVISLAEQLSQASLGSSDRAYTPDDMDLAFRRAIQNGNTVVQSHVGAIDSAIGGFFPTELTVIAARPGMGKTAIAAQIARSIAHSGRKVLFISLEMAKEQLWARMVCPLVGVSWKDVRAKNVSQQQLAKLEIESVAYAAKLGKLLLVHDSSFTLPEIHRLAIVEKPDIVIIDQLPEIHWHDPYADEIKWYGQACKYLRDYVAKALHVPVILIHQLSRDVEKRNDKRPVLSDLRWSGEIEQRADVVLMCYRDDYYEENSTGNSVPFELWVRKNRQGVMSSCVFLTYNLKDQWFT